MKSTRQAIDGLLLLDKPAGITSNAALQRARALLNAKKAGHTGTLDPFADGLLPLCFGEATKFSAFLLDADKHYQATLQLGVTTRTGDPEGEVLATAPVTVTRADVLAVLPRFTGEIEQVPPMHSALKHQGRPLYDYARAGIEIDRPARQVTIRALELVECDLPRVVLDVACSAGTYVRTLAQDIGAALGCGAHLTQLKRTAAGGFALANAVSLAELERLDPARRLAALMPADRLVAHLPALDLDDADATCLRQGRALPAVEMPPGLVRLYSNGRFIGVGEARAGELVSRRLLATGQT